MTSNHSSPLAAALANALDHRDVRGLQITAVMEPLAGPFTPVKTAVYAGPDGSSPSIYEGYSPINGEPATIATVVSDEASRNIAERCLLAEFPEMRSMTIHPSLDDDGRPAASDSMTVDSLLPIDVLELPHSIAATHLYLTDLFEDGARVDFPDSSLLGKHAADVGRPILYATGPHDARWIYENVPGAVVSGYWFSIDGKHKYPAQHTNSKMIASCRFPIVAVGAKQLNRRGGALDPIILATSETGVEGVHAAREAAGFPGTTKDSGKPIKLSTILLGSVPPSVGNTGIPWVTAQTYWGAGNVSFDALRRLQFPGWTAEQASAARATLASISILSIVSAAHRLDVRSGTDLVATDGVNVSSRGGSFDADILSNPDAAAELVRACDAAAVNVGLQSVFGDNIALGARPELRKLIDNGVAKAATENAAG